MEQNRNQMRNSQMARENNYRTEQSRSSFEARKRKSRALAKRRRRLRRILAFSLLFILIFIISITTFAVKKIRNVDVTLEVASVQIVQGEKVPAFTAKAACVKERKGKRFLERKEDYRIRDLVDDLNAGNGYTIVCDADGKQEGSYKIEIQLTDELQKQLKKDWKRVTLITSDGKLTIKNKLGEWDGDKFKCWDGTYLVSDFVTDQGETYYLDSDGNKVTGTHHIGTAECVFDEKGRLQSKEIKIDPNKPMMALTFDDGPGERTDELLEVLNKYNAHATFFMLGEKVEGQDEVIQKMVEYGCELGSHTYNHPALSGLDAAGVSDQMNKTSELIKKAAGKSETVMRPPYGDYAGEAADNVGLPIILWNVDTLDWDTMNAQATIDTVKEYADDGDIVLMHDIHSPTIDAALELIPYLISEGYQLVTVSELAEARGITLQNGVAYTDFNL